VLCCPASCLCGAVQRAADPSGQVDAALGAERIHGSLTQAILVDFCAVCLTRTLELLPSQIRAASFAIMDDEETSPSLRLFEGIFDKDETECLQAVCSFIFGFHEVVPLCNSSDAVRHAQDMLQYLAVLAASDGTTLCPVSATVDETTVSRHAQTVRQRRHLRVPMATCSRAVHEQFVRVSPALLSVADGAVQKSHWEYSMRGMMQLCMRTAARDHD
jgi:hypothetical protein